MHMLVTPALRFTPPARTIHAVPRKGPGEEKSEDEEGLELPVNPDEGTPMVPDEEGVVPVPS